MTHGSVLLLSNMVCVWSRAETRDGVSAGTSGPDLAAAAVIWVFGFGDFKRRVSSAKTGSDFNERKMNRRFGLRSRSPR